jgi:hypothetical protein
MGEKYTGDTNNFFVNTGALIFEGPIEDIR